MSPDDQGFVAIEHHVVPARSEFDAIVRGEVGLSDLLARNESRKSNVCEKRVGMPRCTFSRSGCLLAVSITNAIASLIQAAA